MGWEWTSLVEVDMLVLIVSCPKAENVECTGRQRRHTLRNKSTRSCLKAVPNKLYNIKLTQLFTNQTNTSTVRRRSTYTVSVALFSGKTPWIRATTIKGPTETHCTILSITTRAVNEPETTSFTEDLFKVGFRFRRHSVTRMIMLQTVSMITGAENRSPKSMKQLWYSFSYL